MKKNQLKMQLLLRFTLFALFSGWLIIFTACEHKMQPLLHPAPTNGTIIKEDMEEGNRGDSRRAWFEKMHQAAPGTNWKEIELQTALSIQDVYLRNNNSQRGDLIEIANGRVAGKWSEKGSNNQAGSVIASAYDKEMDLIYTIAAGGSVFKGTRKNETWEVVNQLFEFDGTILEIFEYNDEKRMLASAAGTPMISHDMGISWTPATGLQVDDTNARTYNCVIIGDEDPYIYVLSKKGYWDPIFVYRSTNGGKSFHPIRSLGNSATEKFWLTSPEGSDQLYLFDNIDGTRTDLYRYDRQVNVFWPIQTTTDLTFNQTPTIVQSMMVDSTIHFYTYATGDTVKVSIDTGKTWTSRGIIPEHPWSRRFFVFPSNPEHMLAGGVELFTSHDGGYQWTKMNHWWEYYDRVDDKIHADIMYFREFYAESEEEYFTLISNHGGMNMTTDYGTSTQNIGMVGLNVSQYYSVRTDPTDPSIIYAGSQDQGFQRGFNGFTEGPVDFDQLISGDYGHIVFSESGSRLWTVYPNGSVSYYHNPKTDGGPVSWYDLDSENETVWIPPLLESPYQERNEIYMAGGNINGGPGSHLIKLTYESSNIKSDQFDYNFLDAGLGEITSIAFSEFDPNVIYVGTEDGGFLTSFDGGVTWTENGYIGPGAQYLYGNDIYPSDQNPGTLIFAGSGYSNSPIFISDDDGLTFQPMDHGLPPTLVYQVAGNEDETLLFAATESGPYVYVSEDSTWYPMAEGIAPATRYWSVEYLDQFTTVRFGTYGRGIWDFQLSKLTPLDHAKLKQVDWRVSPNPTSEYIKVELPLDNNHTAGYNLFIYSNQGELLFKQAFDNNSTDVNLSRLSPGIYFVQVILPGQTGIKKIIKY